MAFYGAKLKNKAMTANVYGQTYGSYFCQENVTEISENWKVFAMFMNYIDLFCSFVLFINLCS